jgi:hypothetical protein
LIGSRLQVSGSRIRRWRIRHSQQRRFNLNLFGVRHLRP